MATPTELEHYKQLLLTTLTRLGCLINWEKSSLKPSPQKEFIGYIVITESTGELSNNQSSGHSHPATETRYPSHPEVVNCNARVLARIAGQCIVMTKALVLGKLLGRRSSWDSPLLLDGPTKDDLTRWYHALESWNGRPIKTKPVEAQLVTDASQTGWGAVLNGKQATGYRDKQVALIPLNYRESLAILRAINAFENDPVKVQKRQVLSDNVVVGWPHHRSRGPGFGSLDYHLRVRNQAFRKASGGQRKCPCRPPVSSVTTLRMGASPTSVQVPRSHLWA